MTHTDCRQVQHPIIPIIIRALVNGGGGAIDIKVNHTPYKM